MSQRTEETRPIRVMTYNIHRWAGHDQRIDLNRLATVIRSSGADVIALNEVLHPVTDAGGRRQLLRELAEMLGMTFAFGASGWTDYGPDWHGPVGNALLSRFPLEAISNTLLPRLPSTKQRSLLGARLADGPACGLAAYVTHLDHAFEGTRLVQLGGILERIAQATPHFLAGDFNTPGFHGLRTRRLLPPVLRKLKTAGYLDAFHAVGLGSGRTFPSQSPLWRIDFLFFPQGWARGLRTARTLDLDRIHQVSDHRPVVVEWAMPQATQFSLS